MSIESLNNIDSQPTEVTSLQFDDEHIYSPVKWQDGITPINQGNLNRLDTALDHILGETTGTGYVKKLITKLNQEVQARKTDVQTLIDELNKVIQGINTKDTSLLNKINKLNSSMNELQQSVESVSSSVDNVIQEVDESELIIDNHANRLNDVESSIAALNDSVSELDKKIEEGIGSVVIPDNVVTTDDVLHLYCGNSTTMLD